MPSTSLVWKQQFTEAPKVRMHVLRMFMFIVMNSRKTECTCELWDAILENPTELTHLVLHSSSSCLSLATPWILQHCDPTSVEKPLCQRGVAEGTETSSNSYLPLLQNPPFEIYKALALTSYSAPLWVYVWFCSISVLQKTITFQRGQSLYFVDYSSP